MNHYGDNLFVLGEMIRVLKDGLELELDASLFGERVTGEIFFIDGALCKLFLALNENPHLVDRPENLKSLMRSERLFVGLLEEIGEERFSLSEELKPLLAKLKEAVEVHQRNIGEVQAILAHTDVAESGDMISPAEYEFLLMDKGSPES